MTGNRTEQNSYPEQNSYSVLRSAYTQKYQKSNDLLDLFACYELAAISLLNEVALGSCNPIPMDHWRKQPASFGHWVACLKQVLSGEDSDAAFLTGGLKIAFAERYLQLCEEIGKFSFSTDFSIRADAALSELLVDAFNPVVQLRNLYVHDRIEEIVELRRSLEALFEELFKELRLISFRDPKREDLVANEKGKRLYLVCEQESKYRGSDLCSRRISSEKAQIRTCAPIEGARPSDVTFAGIEFVHIPAGSVTLKGYDAHVKDEHFVSSFYVAKYPVTLGEFNEFLQENEEYAERRLEHADFLKGLRQKRESASREYALNSAVYYVSWLDAREYCDWLSRKNNLLVSYGDSSGISRQGFRLPTEYEWYHASTCGKGAKARIPPRSDIVFRENRGKYSRTSKNSELIGNEWGVAGMLGNINEWTNSISKKVVFKKFESWKASSSKRQPRVLIAGGSFASPWHLIRHDYSTDVDHTNCHYIGIRLALDSI
jgi:formylglycine-generating enzyme required for sulfatase activity